MTYDVFVSYSSKDKIVADAVVASLEQNAIRCWYAPRDIKPSDDWGESITSAIEESKIFLLIFSGNANHSRHVLDELTYAVDEELTILPFRIENLTPVGAMRLHLSTRHWLDAYDPSWEAHIKRLVADASLILQSKIDEEQIRIPENLIKITQTEKKKRSPGVIMSIVVTILVILGFIFGQKILGLITPQESSTIDESQEIGIPPFTGETFLQESSALSSISPTALNISESHRPILEFLESYPPIFQEDFSSQSEVWGETSEGNHVNLLVKNEQLVIVDFYDGTGGLPESFTPGVAFSIPGLSGIEDFALAFDFGGNDKIDTIHLRFAAALKAEAPEAGYSLNFNPNYWEIREVLNQSEVGHGPLAVNLSDRSTNILLFIVKDNYTTLYINDEKIFEYYGLVRDYYDKQIEISTSEEGGYACFDNFQLWDLGSVDIPDLQKFTTGYLDYIYKNKPTFKDDFSTPDETWGNYRTISEEGPVEALILNEQLSIPDASGESAIDLPVYTSDFALSFDISSQAYFKGFNLDFRWTQSPLSFYGLSIDAQSNFSIHQIIKESSLTFLQGTWINLNASSTHQVLIIAKEENMAIFWDEILLYDNPNATLSGKNIGLNCGGEKGAILIDNIQLWDLQDINLDF